MWLKGTGVIQYDPPRGKMKKKTNWWCVINVDKEITRYYRWWLVRELHVKGMNAPAWDAHISVIRGEKPRPELMSLWKKYDGQRVEFLYEHNPRPTSKPFFWQVEVKCEFGINIRKEFKLKHDWPLHLTVGRTYY